jgi:hypothetical protein
LGISQEAKVWLPGGLFEGDENVLELIVVMAVKFYEYTKVHQIIHLKEFYHMN